MEQRRGTPNYTTDAGSPLEKAEEPTQRAPISLRQRNLVLGIVNASHVFNHMQSSMVSVLYPVMMEDLGFGFFAIGLLQTIYQLTAMGFQVIYGVLVRFLPRSYLLGAGNTICGAFYITTGFCQSLTQVALVRGLSGLGSSAQHPVGSAVLVSYFEKARGRALTLHHSAGNLGAFLAPAIAGALLLFTDWRTVFYVGGIPGVLMGLSYFFFRNQIVVAGESKSKKEKAAATFQDYRACLKNRNVVMISLIQMVGAAGRGTGINVAFLTAFFMARLGVSITAAAGFLMVYQLSGLLGPLFIGWLSDRFNRKAVLQLTLLGSTLATLGLLAHSSINLWLILNLILYGCVIQSCGSLTQSVVSEAVPQEKMDVAFSIYFFIGFVSGPAWTFLVGWLIDTASFSLAFQVVSVSYVVGMLLVFFTAWTEANPTFQPQNSKK